jgi:hypothetical protein
MLHLRLLLLGLISLLLGELKAQDATSVIQKMRTAIAEINAYEFELHTKERWGNKYVKKKMYFKVVEEPKKIYMKDLDKGVELLYKKGWNSNKAFINPNGFPWVNVSLSLFDNNVLEDSHHSLYDLGFKFVNVLLDGFERSIKKNNSSPERVYKYKGLVKWGSVLCHKLEVEPPVVFKIIDYTITEETTLFELARKLNVSAFVIKEKNKLSYKSKIKRGTILKVPSAFAKKVVVYIDAKTYLPITQITYDDKNIFEQMEYKNISLQPNFKAEEFTTDYKEYGF